MPNQLFSAEIRLIGENIKPIKEEGKCKHVAVPSRIIRMIIKLYNHTGTTYKIVGIGGLKGIRFVQDIQAPKEKYRPECVKFTVPENNPAIDLELTPQAELQPDSFIEICVDIIVTPEIENEDVIGPIEIKQINVYYYPPGSAMLKGVKPNSKAINVTGHCTITIAPTTENVVKKATLNQLVDEEIIEEKHIEEVWKTMGNLEKEG